MSKSIFRVRSRAVNKETYFKDRVANFLTPPIRTGDLNVENNEVVGGNLTIKKDLHATNFYATGNYYLNNYILIPPGTIIQSAAINVPNGWLECDGAEYIINEYPDLFGAIGYTYGGAVLNFSVPDLRGRVGLGSGHGDGLTIRELGDKGGEETHTLTTAEMPSHHHNYNDAYFAEAGSGTPKVYGTSAGTDGDNNFRWRTANGSYSSSPEDIPTSNTGSGSSHNNMQPYLVLRYLIKY